MRKKNWSTEPPVGDAASAFLLQFDESPTYVVHYPQDHSTAPGAAQRFDACVIQRTTKAPLTNGTALSDEPNAFVLWRGDFGLLRPEENSTRPGVARIHSFMRTSGGKLLARVQWFYRAEDLTERPPSAVGEDELFESMHYDDVQLVALVGRAAVNGYDVWEREFAERSHLNPPKPDPEPESESEKGSDASSFFWDNFSDSAVHYYCRYMYDPYGHLFVPSRFEDPDADPENDLAELREQAAQDARDRDGDYDGTGGDVDDDDDDDELNVDENTLVDELDDLKRSRGRKRARGPTARPRGVSGVVDGPREKAAQFCLPTDIGDDCDEPLPCRDDEKAHVRRFLTDAIAGCAAGQDGGARCLYVSGMPGTGKTATIREELRHLRVARAKGEVAAFETLEINGMSVPDPSMVYVELLAAMTGNRRVAPAQAAALLEKRFARGDVGAKEAAAARAKRTCIVLLLDEMDVLVARAQKVLYDVLDWPTRKGSNLVVIGVANTMDLPERMLPRLASRLGLNRLQYPPYNKSQLERILGMRLPNLHPDARFDPATVKLCAAKVGAVSGDVRRALQLCRRAVDLARDNGSFVPEEQTVTATPKKGKRTSKAAQTPEPPRKVAVKAVHLTSAVQHASGAARLAALTQLSQYETLTLVAAIALVRAHGSFAVDETASVQAVCERARELAAAHRALFKSGMPRSEELEECVLRLESLRIILLERGSMLRTTRVIINLMVDDCCFALRDHPLAKKVLTVDQ